MGLNPRDTALEMRVKRWGGGPGGEGTQRGFHTRWHVSRRTGADRFIARSQRKQILDVSGRNLKLPDLSGPDSRLEI